MKVTGWTRRPLVERRHFVQAGAAAERRRPAGPGDARHRTVDHRLEPNAPSALAAYLHELNGSRESLERSIYLAAQQAGHEQFDPEGDAALVLAERGWHPGVIGIVAGGWPKNITARSC